jgi:hypothetical protein
MFDLDGAVRAWRRDFARERAFTTADLDELEDHLRAAYEVELDLDPGLAPARAFTCACETLGTATDLSSEFAKVEGKAWRLLVRTGWAVYGLAFFLPVARYGITLGQGDVHDGLLPGVEALLLALKGAGGITGIFSALTNLVMFLTFRRITEAGRSRVGLLAALMLAATVLNLWWLFAVDQASDLYAGYYAWLASFELVGTGLALRARALPEATTSADVIVAP